MASRSLLLLHPPLREKAALFLEACQQARHPAIITCTGRFQAEQVALHAQGRRTLSEVNNLRMIAGMPLITEEENRRRVTWTLQSQHLINPQTGFCNAFDFALLNGKKAHWDIKVSVDGDEIPDYEEAGQIGEQLGLTWGGRWDKPDYPHFQLMPEV